MLFNSYTFILFFAVVLVLHHLPLPWWLKKFNLLIASYLFYAAWNPPFVALIWLSTIVDWFAARGIARSESLGKRRALLLLSIAVNLGLLGYFKYGDFLLDNFVAIASAAGIDYSPVRFDIVLPVGISFYTFQTLSYTLDVYRGAESPCRSWLDFALYVTFFPQLVAGPIVRAGDFLPQCETSRNATGRQFAWGLALLLLGLFEKVVVADGLAAPLANKVFNSDTSPTTVFAWCGATAFAVQIFCDFAGYSSCAIGVAMCLGFSIPDNFRSPYAAIGFSDFWQRWHISLSSWLRDYLYIPLGGNRKGVTRTYINLMMTMLIGGLWHGASWTFVAWGGLHGFYLVVERLLRRRKPSTIGLFNRRLSIIWAVLTFSLTCFTWVFFRAETFSQAASLCLAMIGIQDSNAVSTFGRFEVVETIVLVGAMLTIQWRLRETTLEDAVAGIPWWLRSLAIAIMLIGIMNASGKENAFIYFQF